MYFLVMILGDFGDGAKNHHYFGDVILGDFGDGLIFPFIEFD